MPSMTQLVLPHMRSQRSGTIVNITSMGGKIHTPLGAWYHGTKFAFEAIGDCLRMEVQPFGIDVVVIEPGGIRTEWADIAADKLRDVSDKGAYAGQTKAMALSMVGEASRKRQSPPQLIADTIAKAVSAGRPKTRYAVGFGQFLKAPVGHRRSIAPPEWIAAMSCSLASPILAQDADASRASRRRVTFGLPGSRCTLKPSLRASASMPVLS